MSQPAARIRSPPTPKNSSEGSQRLKAWISCAPYISPEASPAEMRIRTEDIVPGYNYFGATAPPQARITLSLIIGAGRDLRACAHRNFLIFVLELIELVVDAALGQ